MHTRVVWMENVSMLRPCTKPKFFHFPKDKVCPVQKPTKPQTYFSPVWSGRRWCYLTVQPVKKLFPKENTLCCSQGNHKHIPVLGGKKKNPMFLCLRKTFLRLTGEMGSYSISWSKIKNYLSLEQLDETQDPRYSPTFKRLLLLPQILYIYVLLIWWESCLKLLSLDTLVSPPYFTSLLLPAHQPSGSISILGLRVLLTNPFHLLRHDNPHSQFKFTAVMFQGFAQRLTGSTDRY